MSAGQGRGWWWIGGGLLALTAGAVGACDVRPNSPAVQECPPCDCKSDGKSDAGPAKAAGAATGLATGSGGVTIGPAIGSGPAPSQSADAGELIASATRKMMHGDGAGCLADLDRLAGLDPKMHARVAVTRGQCEMLVGRCQPGKQRIARWYEVETGVSAERAMLTAEQIASMHCRGGDASERDRLLRAYFDLSDGAYMNKRSPEFCKTALQTVRELLPRVQPRGPDDTQISGGAQALFHTAASCFARAGDCKSAWTTYRDLFPNTAMTTPEAAAMLPKIIQDSYDSGVLFCGANKKGPPPVPQLPPPR